MSSVFVTMHTISWMINTHLLNSILQYTFSLVARNGPKFGVLMLTKLKESSFNIMGTKLDTAGPWKEPI